MVLSDLALGDSSACDEEKHDKLSLVTLEEKILDVDGILLSTSEQANLCIGAGIKLSDEVTGLMTKLHLETDYGLVVCVRVSDIICRVHFCFQLNSYPCAKSGPFTTEPQWTLLLLRQEPY